MDWNSITFFPSNFLLLLLFWSFSIREAILMEDWKFVYITYFVLVPKCEKLAKKKKKEKAVLTTYAEKPIMLWLWQHWEAALFMQMLFSGVAARNRLFMWLVGHHSSKGRSRAEAECDGYYMLLWLIIRVAKHFSIPCGMFQRTWDSACISESTYRNIGLLISL